MGLRLHVLVVAVVCLGVMLASASFAQARTKTKTKIDVSGERVLVTVTPSVPSVAVKLTLEVVDNEGKRRVAKTSLKYSKKKKAYQGPSLSDLGKSASITARFPGNKRYQASSAKKEVRSSGDDSGTGGSVALTNLGVKFGAWNPVTNRAGDFLFTDMSSQQNAGGRVFAEFGAVGFNLDPTTPNHSFKYFLPGGTKITAMADTTVLEVKYQAESEDYQIASRSDGGYTFTYDHILSPTVSAQKKVKAGSVIGEVGGQPTANTLGYVEVDVFKSQNNGTVTFYCPIDLLASAVKNSIKQSVTALMDGWEQYSGNAAIYDQLQMVEPGCTTHSITSK